MIVKRTMCPDPSERGACSPACREEPPTSPDSGGRMTTPAGTSTVECLRSTRAVEHFERLCALISQRRRGITLRDLGIVGALVRELDGADPDPGRLSELAKRIGVELPTILGVTGSDDPEAWQLRLWREGNGR